jgi:thiol-disulfide isomerase/thioredoxin
VSTRQVLALVVLALASAASGYLAYTGLRAPSPTAAPATDTLPAFALTDLDGVVRRSTEWEGEVRVVNFWATWCPPCRREIPLLKELQAEYGDRVRIIGIAIDDMEAVQEYALEAAFNYPVLVGQQDAVELGNRVLEDWIGLPFTAFADASGRVHHVHVGELHREQAEDFIGSTLQ